MYPVDDRRLDRIQMLKPECETMFFGNRSRNVPTLGQHHCELPTVLHSKLFEHDVDCEQPVSGVSSKNEERDSYSGAPRTQAETTQA
ncbi:hypothetical protein RB195_010117 [Necator americanus]|uniref:Uncharacterized protein n=1 Tax=Necator americanus TaxID=51031 RepID=A0ABR1CYW4_NECAM